MKRQISIADIKINSKAKKYLNRIIATSRLTYGPFTRKLEAKFAKIHHRRWAIFTSSGTGALQAGLAALKETHHWHDGDEVLVPAISFVSTANIVYHLRLKPVFVDVELETYNLDPDQIKKHITKKTRAIIPVHILGLPANMPAIINIAKQYNLKAFEDSCDAMFVTINKKPVGSFGEIAAFSTYVAHLLPTGVGGFLVGDNAKLEKIARSYTFHGRHTSYLSIDDDDKNKFNQAFKNRFRFDRIGSHFRLTELEAAIGLSQLETKEYSQNIKKRQDLARLLIKLLKPLEDKLQLPYSPAGFQHAYMMFPLMIKDSKIDKWQLMLFLEKNNIETRELLPLLNQPAYKKTFGNLEKKYPNAAKINKNGFYFGCHPYMNQSDIKYIAKKIHEFLSK
jgi:dTDP-4-amino-4,6-dideoxygalactose transaminase